MLIKMEQIVEKSECAQERSNIGMMGRVEGVSKGRPSMRHKMSRRGLREDDVV